MACEHKTGGHFKFVKNISRLNNFCAVRKSKDDEKYMMECIPCQPFKDSNKETDRSSVIGNI